MKFQPDTSTAPTIIAHSASAVTIGTVDGSQALRQEMVGSFILSSRGSVQLWAARQVQDLTAEDFTPIAAIAPQVCIFGSGAALRFPPPAALKSLMLARIGLETMDNAAACRTYNVLAAEGRDVVLALLLPA